MPDPRPIAGLQTSIWNNNLKSMALLALYPLILAATVFIAFTAYGLALGSGAQNTLDPALGFAAGMTARYFPTVVAVVAVWFVIAYFFQGSMIRAMAKSHGVGRTDEPALYNLLENLCISQGMKMPRLEIVESHARNAFASGINDSTYCITVTRGLMQSLSKDELEAVLAHELTHILNRDVRLLMVCVVFTGMFGLLAQLLWSHFRYAMWIPRRGNDRGGGGIMLMLFALMLILWVGYLASLLARFAISRSREFMADAGAVRMTKNPEAMMRALVRISGAADIPKSPADIKAMCFENAQAFMGVFATHPPIKARIRAIADYSGIEIPNIPPKISASEEDAFGRPAPPRDNWTTRQRFKERRKNPWV